MRINRLQIGLVLGSLVIFTLLVALGRTKPFHKENPDANPADTLAFNDDAMLAGARQQLDSTKIAYLAQLEQQKAQAANLEEEVLTLKLLSRTWNEFGNFAVGGYFAQKVAELSPTGEAWAIAGSTFGIAFNKEQKDMALKKYVGHKAVDAFQKAAQLEPDSVLHGINEALMLVELSMVDTKVPPMSGAQKLLAIDKANPNNLLVNLHLGRLSLNRSGDLQKAMPRFEKIIAISDSLKVDNAILLEAHYSLAECYKQSQKPEKVLEHYDACMALTQDNKVLFDQLKAAKELYQKEGK